MHSVTLRDVPIGSRDIDLQLEQTVLSECTTDRCLEEGLPDPIDIHRTPDDTGVRPAYRRGGILSHDASNTVDDEVRTAIAELIPDTETLGSAPIVTTMPLHVTAVSEQISIPQCGLVDIRDDSLLLVGEESSSTVNVEVTYLRFEDGTTGRRTRYHVRNPDGTVTLKEETQFPPR